MKNEDIKTYIGQIINDTDIGNIDREIPAVELLFSAYVAGLERKDFPVDLFWHEFDIEKDIPAPYHSFIAQLAILKSDYKNHRVKEFLRKECDNFSERMKWFFIPRNQD